MTWGSPGKGYRWGRFQQVAEGGGGAPLLLKPFLLFGGGR